MRKQVRLYLLILLVLAFSSVVLADRTDLDYTADAADMSATDGSNRSSQVRWDISSLPAGHTIVDAQLCFVVGEAAGADSDITVFRVNDQSWADSLTNSGWNAQSVTNQSSGTMSGSLSAGNTVCMNVTHIIAEDYKLGNTYSSVRFEDPDVPIDKVSGATNNGDYNDLLVSGTTSPTFTFYSKEWAIGEDATQGPWLNITSVSEPPPVVTHYNITPAYGYTDQVFTANVTCYDVDAGDTITAYWQKYNGSNAYGSVGSSVVSNDTRTNVVNITSSETYRGNTYKVEFWCGDGVATSTKYNTSAVSINNSRPGAPSAGTPSHNHSLSVNLTWTEGTDLDGDAISTKLWVGTSPGGNNTAVTVRANPYYLLTGLHYNGTSEMYYITAWSKDSVGVQNMTNYNWTLNITETQPTAPSALKPVTNHSTSVVFNYTQGTDADSDTLVHYISIDTSSFTTAGGQFQTVTTNAYFSLANFTHSGTLNEYFVRIWASDNTSSSIENSSYYDISFNITNAAPSIPVLDAEADTHTAANVTLEWSASTDTDGDAVTYDIYIGSSAGSDDKGNWTGVSGLSQATEANLTEWDTAFYWSVRACDNLSLCSAFASEDDFSRTNAQPTAPSAINVSTIHQTDPWLNFSNSTDSDSDQIVYRISVDTSSYTYTGDTWVSTISNPFQMQNLAYDSTKNTYYVRLWANDSTGASDQASTAYDFLFNVTNTRPNAYAVEITNTTYNLSATLTCGYTYNDTDGDAEGTEYYRWWVQDEGAGAFVLDATTTSTFSGGFDEDDVVLCGVLANDSIGLQDTAYRNSTTWTVGNANPIVTAADVLPNNPLNTDNLSCNYTYSDIDGDADSGTTFKWYNSSDASTWAVMGVTTKILNATYTTTDYYYICEVTPNDGTVAGPAVNSTNEQIGSSAPTIQALTDTSSSASPTEIGDTVLFNADWSDVDQPGENARLYICNATGITSTGCAAGTRQFCNTSNAASDPVNCTYTALAADRTTTTYYAMVCDDGDECSTESSGSFDVNHPPTAGTLTLTPTTPNTTSTLNCTLTGSTDSDSDSLTITYLFNKTGNASIQGWSTTKTLDCDTKDCDKADEIACYSRVQDQHGTNSSTANLSRTVVNSIPPGVTAGLTDLGTHLTDHTPEVRWTGVTDDDADTIYYLVYVNGTLDSNSTKTGRNLSVTLTDGLSYGWWVQTHDGTTYGQNSTEDGFRMNSVPTMSAPTMLPAAPNTSSLMNCSHSAAVDNESDAVTYYYAWYINGVINTSQTAQTMDCDSVAGCDRDILVKCSVTPFDNYENGTTQFVNATINNTAPSLTSPTLNDSTPGTNAVVKCDAGSYSDIDSDSQGTTWWRWYVNSVIRPTETSQTMDLGGAGNGGVGDNIVCSEKTTDGTDNSSWMNSTAATIIDYPPVISDISVTPAAPYYNDTLSVQFNITDPDSASVTANITWYNNTVLYLVNESVSCSLDNWCRINLTVTKKVNQVWNATVKAIDDTGSTDTDSVKATVQNYAPKATSQEITPLAPLSSQDLTCTFTYSDPEGEAKQAYYAWFKNDAYDSVVGDTNTYPSSETQNNDNITCQVTPHDSYVNGTAANTSTVNVGDTTIPILTNVSSSGTSAYLNGNVIFYARCSDSDAGVQFVKFQFYQLGHATYDPAVNVTGTSAGGLYSVTRTMTTAGTFQLQAVYCYDNSGNAATNTTGISVTVSEQPTLGGGGSPGQDTDLQSVEQEVTEQLQSASICGNGVCQEGESPANCPQDCGDIIGSLICWPPTDSSCLFGQAWFLNWSFAGMFGLMAWFAWKRKGGGKKMNIRWPKL